MTDTDGRIVRVIRQPNPAIMRVEPDPSLSAVMGRFQPARYDRAHHAYDVPAAMADAFGSFCRVHGLTLIEGETSTPISVYRTPDTERILSESRARRGTAEQAAVNERGAAKVRAAFAAMHAEPEDDDDPGGWP